MRKSCWILMGLLGLGLVGWGCQQELEQPNAVDDQIEGNEVGECSDLDDNDGDGDVDCDDTDCAANPECNPSDDDDDDSAGDDDVADDDSAGD